MSDESEPVAVVAASEPAPAAQPVGPALIVERWFNAHIANSPVARSVEAINHLRAALPALVAALLQQKD